MRRRPVLVTRAAAILGALSMLLSLGVGPAGAVVQAKASVGATTSGDVAMPDWVGLFDDYTWVGERLVATRADPLVQIGACARDETGHTAEDLAVVDVEVRLLGSDVEVASGPLDLLDDGTGCFLAEWRVPALQAVGEFTLEARGRDAGAQTSEWLEGDRFIVAPVPQVPVGVAPVANTIITQVNWPEFSVQLDAASALPLSAIFRVVNKQTGVVEAEGKATSVVDGLATWIPIGFNAGHYEWQALATDEISQSDWTEPTPFSVLLPPEPPIISGTSLSRRGVRVDFMPRPTAGEDPVLDYTLRAEPGGHRTTVPADQLWASLTDLDAGTYELALSARNVRGEGRPAKRTVVIAPPTADSPLNLAAEVHEGRATVTWDPPADDGGAPVLGYEVVAERAGFSTQVAPDTRSVTIDGLEPGAYYDVTVRARTERGLGLQAWQSFVYSTPPGAPTDVTVLLGDRRLTVRWSPPEFDGGSYVGRYVVTALPGGQTRTVDEATELVFDGLENGVDYRFVVAAVNEFAQGPESAPSAPKAPTEKDTDTDHDGVTDIVEERVGSNILLSDSDFDGLTDAVEVFQLIGFTSPVSADSDDDGTSDADADSDRDGLTNGAEVAANTDAGLFDTDADGLSDAQELEAGSDPRSDDADGDGLRDPDEVALGLDPSLADSDGDGVDDASSIVDHEFERSQDNEWVTLTASGSAGVLAEMSVQAVPAPPIDSAVTGAVTIVDESLSLEPEDGAQQAGERASRGAARAATEPSSSLAFRLSPNQPVEDRPFAAFAWEEGTREWVDSGLDVEILPDEMTVRVVGPKLGVAYTVVDLDEWRSRARACFDASTGAASLDVELVLDETPSMQSSDPDGSRYEAAAAVLDTLRTGDDVRMRTFAYDTTTFGWGESYVPRFTSGPAFPGLGLSRAEIGDELDRLESLPPWESIPDDHDNAIEGFAEEALGRQSEAIRDANPYVAPEVQSAMGTCRAPAIVLVTDGLLVPSTENGGVDLGYTPFRVRTDPPVHVLDVGVGGDDSWLRDVAQRTGGSYTHVPSQSWVNTWARDLDLSDIDPALDAVDDDGDGLSNYVEIVGIRPANPGAVGSTSRRVFYSDPADPDTDGDGIPDGEEVGTPASISELGAWLDDRPVTTYRVVSDPARQDGDLDGLVDSEELELEFPALDADSDGDLLPDGGEVEWGTNPFVADVDHDEQSDGFEAANVESGWDPWVYTPVVTIDDWVADFQRGFWLGEGDVDPSRSWAWTLGSISAGVLIVGDIRDAVAATGSGDYTTAHWAVIGAVPAIGDVARIGHKLLDASSEMSASVATVARRTAADVMSPLETVERWRVDHPGLIAKLENTNASVESIAKLLSKNDPKLLDDMATSPLISFRPLATKDGAYLASGRAGETHVREEILGLPPLNTRERALWTGGGPRPWSCGGCRYPDVIERLGRRVISHEVKVGRFSSWFSLRQIIKDRELLDEKQFDEVVWHALPSRRSNSVGPSRTAFEQLKAARISLVIYF